MEDFISLIARGVFWLFVEMFFYKLCYVVGYYSLRLISAGKHPKYELELHEEVENYLWGSSLVSLFGLLLIAFAIGILLHCIF